MTYISSVAWEIPGWDVVSGGPSGNLIYQTVELLELVSNFLITCVFPQKDVGVYLRLLAEVLVQILKGCPIAPTMVEGRLIEEVSEAEWR